MSVAVEIDMISPAEVDRLAELEAVVERGKAAFVEVGNALLEIRDARLYRESHTTFEGYCRERWSFERAHAYRLIDGARVAAAVSPNGDIPANEAQARALAPLLDEPDRLRDAWTEANTTGGTTAAKVREIVERRRDDRDHDQLRRGQGLIKLYVETIISGKRRAERYPQLAVSLQELAELPPTEARKDIERLDEAVAYLLEMREALVRASNGVEEPAAGEVERAA